MTGPAQRPLLFLDVDGPLIPFGATPQDNPDGYPTYRRGPGPDDTDANPLLARINPGHGARLATLPCDLVWATTWMADANRYVSPRLGLPELAVLNRPDPTGADESARAQADEQADERSGLHWKTRALVDHAAGRPFVWVDDEITDRDRRWVTAHHPGQALLCRVDPHRGLTDADFRTISEWLQTVDERSSG